MKNGYHYKNNVSGNRYIGILKDILSQLGISYKENKSNEAKKRVAAYARVSSGKATFSFSTNKLL